MTHALQFDADLLRRYDITGPRYTSYPTAPQFAPDFGPAEYRRAAGESNARGGPLSLYVHIPFCRTVCFYCACNKIITANYRRAESYLQQLYREIELQGALFDTARPVEQVHFGGGTPTYLSDEDMAELMRRLRATFTFDEGPGREVAIEIDPRTTDAQRIAHLAKLGFNRISLGVQDFDADVQRAVNRIQSYAQTAEVIEAARAHGFGSVNLDLIYGLPRQTPATVARTLEQVLELRPERLAIYNYAHLPAHFKPQRQIQADELPSPDTKLDILRLVIERLTEAGYVYIGMDHFALPDDELAVAQREGTIQRNFQGYSTKAELDLLGLGVSAIGRVGDTYVQSQKDLVAYGEALDAGELPVWRGYRLNADDRLRRDVIMSLMCRSELDFDVIERAHGIDFADYFADELAALRALADDGLVNVDERAVQVLPRGRLLLRNVAMVFDAYLNRVPARYSKVI